MAMPEVEQHILDALEGGAAAEGLDIVSVEVSGPASHPTVRVRIEELDGTPVDMDRIAARTPWVSSVVEALDPVPGSYELEVSSPGLARPLRRAADFARFEGSEAEVVTKQPHDGRKTWVGVIAGVDGTDVVLDVDGARSTIPLDDIKSAKLKPDFDRIFAEAKRAAKEAGLEEDVACEDEDADAGAPDPDDEA